MLIVFHLVMKLRKMIYYSGQGKTKTALDNFSLYKTNFFTLGNPPIALNWQVGTPEKEMNSNMLKSQVFRHLQVAMLLTLCNSIIFVAHGKSYGCNFS